MICDLVYFYLLSPLHTGGTTQEGNLLGIARESHTDLPYIPSSSIRGRLRATIDKLADERDLAKKLKKVILFGSEIDDAKDAELVAAYKEQRGQDLQNLVQGNIWIGDGSILWLPVPSLSHGVVWVSCPLLLQRWARLNQIEAEMPAEYQTNLDASKPIYLKDAILKSDMLKEWENWKIFVPQTNETNSVQRVLVLPDHHCATLIQMSLWRQVKIKLDEHKTVDGGFRYEEAIPPDTLMYFPWGITAQANGSAAESKVDFKSLFDDQKILQIGGQESLGRGFVQVCVQN
jgi:CRISPR-associated protein Cmr4